MDKTLQNFRNVENFPVASILIPAKAREAIIALYKFARSADEISDNFNKSHKERKAELKEIYNALEQEKISQIPYFARDYYRTCKDGKMQMKHGLALLQAFIQDNIKERYASWEETLQYCKMSAEPIGKSVLEATREFEADTISSDKICTVLQLINHLQDLKKDFLNDNRVYFDKSFIPDVEELRLELETDNIKKGKKEIINRLRVMLFSSINIIPAINSFRVRTEIATIYEMAKALLNKLEVKNILSKNRIELTSFEKNTALLKAIIWAVKSTKISKISAARKIALKSKSSFVKPLLKLEKDRRNAMLCFYSFCRLVDDCADDISDVNIAQEKLNFWKDQVEKIYSGDVLVLPNHPIAKEMALYVKKYNIEKHHLLEIISGQEMDISGQMNKPSQHVLDEYCYKVASCVGLVSAQIFGYRENKKDRISAFAINLGRALQYINIIRDVKEDAKRNRMYIPHEMLKEYGLNHIKTEEIVNNYGKYEIELQPLIKEMSKQAENYLKLALKNLPLREKENMYPALLMAKIYKKYLEKMKDLKFLFDKQEIKLTLKEKIKLFYEPVGKI